MQRMHRVIAAVGVVGLLVGCAGPSYYVPQGSAYDVSAAQAQIGRAGTTQRAGWTRQQMGDLVRAAGSRLQSAAGPMCSSMRAQICRFNIGISREEAPNAWATGAGQIMITESLLQQLQDETEVAAVLGHEMAHHMTGHLDRAATNQTLGGLAGLLAAGALVYAGGGDTAANQDLLSTGAQLGSAVGRLSYSRDMEREADYVGAYLLARAGYDLDRAGGLWYRLSSRGRTTSTFFDTHPTSPERLAAWQHIITEVRSSPDLLPRRLSN